ncbi:MAG: hypothetical protein V3U31_02595 [Dehalococcoidia bacterium]
MVSTVTTSVSTITTTTTSAVGVSGGEVAVFGLMAMLTLVVFLSFKEVTSSGGNLVLHRLSRIANTAVVPLLFALAATVVIRVASVL